MWDLLLQEGLSWHLPSPPLLWVIQVCSRLALVMGSGRAIPPGHVRGCCSSYSFYFYFPAYFGRESYFVLIVVPQSHSQKNNLANSRVELPQMSSCLIFLGSCPCGVNDNPFPLAEASGKCKGRRRQSGSFPRWVFLSFPDTGEDNHSKVSPAEFSQ